MDGSHKQAEDCGESIAPTPALPRRGFSYPNRGPRIRITRETMNDAEIKELVTEVRRREDALAQAKADLEAAKREAATAACPYKEGDLVVGWDREGNRPAKIEKILFVPSYPHFDLRVLPITAEGKPSRRHRYAHNALDVKPYESDE